MEIVAAFYGCDRCNGNPRRVYAANGLRDGLPGAHEEKMRQLLVCSRLAQGVKWEEVDLLGGGMPL